MKLFPQDIEPNDPTLKRLFFNPRFREDFQFLESIWAFYEPYADANFLVEIRNQFHARFWEMYLAYTLSKLGFRLIPVKSQKGPDICISPDGNVVWIEAIAPSRGTGNDAVPQPNLSGPNECSRVPEEKIILRYASAISAKFQKYVTYLDDGLVKENEPFIIAVNGREIPYSLFEDEVHYIVQSVLPIGPLTTILDANTYQTIRDERAYRPAIVKQNRASVSTRIFLDSDYSGISGVLFSNVAVVDRPSIVGSDFVFVHNPLARNPVPLHWLPVGWEYWVAGNELKKIYLRPGA